MKLIIKADEFGYTKPICDGIQFKTRTHFYENLKDIALEEVYQECKAQIEKFIRVFRRFLDHVNSPHSVHDAGIGCIV